MADTKKAPARVASVGSWTYGAGAASGFVAALDAEAHARRHGATPKDAESYARARGSVAGLQAAGVVGGLTVAARAVGAGVAAIAPKAAPLLGPVGMAALAGAGIYGAVQGYRQTGTVAGAAVGAVAGGAVPRQMMTADARGRHEYAMDQAEDWRQTNTTARGASFRQHKEDGMPGAAQAVGNAAMRAADRQAVGVYKGQGITKEWGISGVSKPMVHSGPGAPRSGTSLMVDRNTSSAGVFAGINLGDALRSVGRTITGTASSVSKSVGLQKTSAPDYKDSWTDRNGKVYHRKNFDVRTPRGDMSV
jgi:hypothetical protein